MIVVELRLFSRKYVTKKLHLDDAIIVLSMVRIFDELLKLKKANMVEICFRIVVASVLLAC